MEDRKQGPLFSLWFPNPSLKHWMREDPGAVKQRHTLQIGCRVPALYKLG